MQKNAEKSTSYEILADSVERAFPTILWQDLMPFDAGFTWFEPLLTECWMFEV